MLVLIEFHRIRESDGAQAVIGRESRQAADLREAIEIAHRLARTLDMPQLPDGMTISDSEGIALYSGKLDAASPLPLPIT